MWPLTRFLSGSCGVSSVSWEKCFLPNFWFPEVCAGCKTNQMLRIFLLKCYIFVARVLLHSLTFRATSSHRCWHGFIHKCRRTIWKIRKYFTWVHSRFRKHTFETNQVEQKNPMYVTTHEHFLSTSNTSNNCVITFLLCNNNLNVNTVQTQPELYLDLCLWMHHGTLGDFYTWKQTHGAQLKWIRPCPIIFDLSAEYQRTLGVQVKQKKNNRSIVSFWNGRREHRDTWFDCNSSEWDQRHTVIIS